MKRKEELKQVAHTTVRAMVADGVKLDGGQHRVSEYHVLKTLQQVEREVLRRCQDKIESLMEKENDSTDDQVWEYRDWLKDQQKELG